MSSLDTNELARFRFIEGGCHLSEDRFTRNHMMGANQIPAFKERFNNTGIYLSAYWYESEQVDTSSLYGHFYLDFDSEEDFEKARRDACDAVHYLTRPFLHNIPERFIRAFFSGQKGIHLVIPAEVFGVQPSMELNHYYKRMAEKIGENIKNGTIDYKVYDRRRLFRVVNSVHHKTGLYKIPLSIEELKTATYDEIIELAKTPRSPSWAQGHEIVKARKFFEECIEEWKRRYEKSFNRDRKEAKPLDFIPACIQELIDAGPQKGKRNNTAAALVSFWKRQGDSEQETWDNLVNWNNGSMSESELKNVTQSVYRRDYEYGCSTLEELATCVEHECPLWKGVPY